MEEQQHILKQDGGETVKVEAVKTSPGTQSSTPWRKSTAVARQRSCTRCGRVPHSCEQRMQLATSANGKGTAFQNQLQRYQMKRLKAARTQHFLIQFQAKGESWRAKVHLCGKETDFKLDTGGEVTAISDKTLKRLGRQQLE